LWWGLYDDAHVLIEGDEEAQKALHGELAEVAEQQLTSGALSPVHCFPGFTARTRALPDLVGGEEIKIPTDWRSRLKPG
jgi:hypothetical protein